MEHNPNPSPLKKYFRQPAIYIKLPSNGNFYEPGSLAMPVNRELPVYPMTAMDEITYRTADALFNGSAVVNVIQSCVPNIKDAWKVPGIDLDTILIGIRIASYGHEMEFDSMCPYCNEENNFGLDLRVVLDGIQHPDYSKSIRQGDVEIFFKPLTYEETNKNAMQQFNDQKLMQALGDADLPDEEKARRVNEAFLKITALTLSAISNSIGLIKAGDDMVTEPEFIEEFVNNCDREFFEVIKDKIIELKETTELKPVHVKCTHCEKEYDSPFTLNVANFFATAS